MIKYNIYTVDQLDRDMFVSSHKTFNLALDACRRQEKKWPRWHFEIREQETI